MEPFTHHAYLSGLPLDLLFLCDIPIFNEGKWRTRAVRSTSWTQFKYLQAQGLRLRLYFVDDHFLLQPRRIEAIFKASTTTASISIGCEGALTPARTICSPAMAETPLPQRSFFGIEERQPKNFLDSSGRKEQNLEETVRPPSLMPKRLASRIVHGFFVVAPR